MSQYQRDPNASASASGYPIARSFAMVVLLALFGLVALRHLFGSISVSGGVK
jgi:hypothetical protein